MNIVFVKIRQYLGLVDDIISDFLTDIKSLRYVSSLLIEPMRSDELSNWINYCLKKKNMENI